MIFYFDDSKNFNEDLERLISTLKRYDNPIVVVPTEKDANVCKRNYIEDPNARNITFISYDYWLSKKWIADGDYDHIDFFRVDQFLMSRCYGVKVGRATVKRVREKKKEEN